MAARRTRAAKEAERAEREAKVADEDIEEAREELQRLRALGYAESGKTVQEWVARLAECEAAQREAQTTAAAAVDALRVEQHSRAAVPLQARARGVRARALRAELAEAARAERRSRAAVVLQAAA
jgi:hypothetical protein